jgi:hypothetical protein
MKFAYADPPYPGQAKRHYADGKDPNAPDVVAEVDHVQLIQRLMDEFPDGWALSTSANMAAFDYVMQCARLVLGERMTDLRVMSWVKPFASYKPNVPVAYAWEPVFVWGGRKRTRQQPTVRDWISANITMRKGTHGAKPPKFCYWLFEVLNMQPEDELHDLFPGSGAVGQAWGEWRSYQRSFI